MLQEKDDYLYEDESCDDNITVYSYDSEIPHDLRDEITPVDVLASPTAVAGFLEGYAVIRDDFEICKQSEMAPLLDDLVAEIASILNLSADETERVLLLHRWDREKLIECHFSDAESNMKEAGLDLYSSKCIELVQPCSPMNIGYEGEKAGLGDVTCHICYEDSMLKETGFSLGCGHTFCKECFAQYLAAQVGDGPQCVLAKCPEHKCTQTITRRVYQAFLQGEDLKKYDVYRVKDFISTSKNMKYCPAPGCDKVAVGSGVTTVRCTCSYSFCFKCSEEAHEPCSCAQLADWALKSSDETETNRWILINTKCCPKCQTSIEKNQGCNHMTCKMCKHEFCWICLQNYRNHGTCNSRSATNPSSEKEKARAELERYLHYFKRFNAHHQSLKFAAQSRAEALQKMEEMQSKECVAWIDLQFMKLAAEQVIECRRVLKYTYVLGYFLPDGTAEKQLFEHHQEMLEKNTELLHEYTEMPLERMDRTQVINLTRVTEKFMSGLLGKMSGGVVLQEDMSFMGPFPRSPLSAQSRGLTTKSRKRTSSI